jgi:hypothetical protein
VQFWDKDHLIASQIRQQMQQFHGTRPTCCDDGGHLWDMAAVYPAGIRWGESGPTFDNGPIYRIATELDKRLTKRQDSRN